MPDQVDAFYFKTTVGMDNRSDDLDYNGKKVRYAQNCRFGKSFGALVKRSPLAYYNTSELAGSGEMLGLYKFYFSGGSKLISVRDDKVYVGDDSAGTFTQIRDLDNSGRRMAFVTYNNLLVGGNGYDNLWVYDGSADNLTWELGACKAKEGAGTGITKTGISYMVTYDNDAYICGAVSNTIASVTNKDIVLTNIPLGPIGSDHRKIYRKDSSTGAAYKLVATLTDDAIETYTDNTADVSGAATVGAVTDAMPKGNILTIHKERLFVSGNPTEQNKVWYSNPFLFHYIQQNTNLDYFEISKDDGDQIQGLPIHLGTMICIKQNTIRKVYVAASSANVDPATWYADDPMAYVGTPAQWSICNTPMGIVFLGWDRWYLFDGSTPQPFIPEFNAEKILPSLYNNVVAYYNNSKLYASFADSETAPQNNNRIMVLDVNLMQYGVDTTTASCFAASVGADESGELYIGSADSGFVFKAEEGDIWHRASSLSGIQNGTYPGLFVGGTEGNPFIQIGAPVAPLAIPEGVCIMWDDDTIAPGSGWTEITNTENRFAYISTTAGTTGGTETHTHSFSGTLASANPSFVDSGDSDGWDAQNYPTHTHTLSGASATGIAYPNYVKFRVFQKNGTTTETAFPVGAIMMWDQSAAPDGWLPMSYLDGSYVMIGNTGLGQAYTANDHSHTYALTSSTLTDISTSGQIVAYAATTGYEHNHPYDGSLLSAETSSWQLDRVQFTFIKNVSPSSPWDGTDKYVYALVYGSAAASNGWEDMSSTYTGRFIKIQSGSLATGSASGSHTHTDINTESGMDPQFGQGPGGYNSQGYIHHKHPVTGTWSTETLPAPKYLSFRLFRKLLGKTVNYNDAITNTYTNGLYMSPALDINAYSFGNFYFNASLEGTDKINTLFRTGATQASVVDGLALTVDHTADKFTAVSHGYSNGDRVSIAATALPTGILDTVLYYVVNVAGSDFKVSLSSGGSPVTFSSNGTAVTSKKWSNIVSVSGSQMTASPSVWIQYLAEFVAADTVASIPTLFYADGYVLKMNYRKSGQVAEDAVEFIYETGYMNYDDPMVDKIFKRLSCEHAATVGSMFVTWTTENATGTWEIDLTRFTGRWQAFFHDNAMGELIKIRFYKNDLADLTLREFKGFYVTQPMLI